MLITAVWERSCTWLRRGFLMGLCALHWSSSMARAQTETILYNFTGKTPGSTAPQVPAGALVMDAQGNFYGATFSGGDEGVGTVFKFAPDGQLTVLHSFSYSSGVDGFEPNGGLILDADGNLYGMTFTGPGSYLGTVYKIAPDGTEIILHTFGGSATDGQYPSGELILDTHGSLYGTTEAGGGSANCGTVFKIAPDGTEAVLHGFTGPDGCFPFGDALAMDAQGNLFGATQNGGAYGFGAVFKVAPDGTETVLHSFNSGAGDGYFPVNGLALDSHGNLYGSTSAGGAAAEPGGVLFKVAPDGTYTLLYSFNAAPPGPANPEAGLLVDANGNIFGTTTSQDLGLATQTSGSAFELTPSGILSILHTFPGDTPTQGGFSGPTYVGPGTFPGGNLLADAHGNLYGAAEFGGSTGSGVLYQIHLDAAAPPIFSQGSGAYPFPVSVAITDITPGSTIYYTTDGTTPTTASAVYTVPVPVTASGTLQAFAVAPGYTNSSVASASYTITGTTCTVIDNSGGFTGVGLSLNGGASVTGGALQLTDGGLNEARSAFTTARVPVESFSTDFTFQLADAGAEGFTFTMQGNYPGSIGAGGGGLGYEGIGSSAAVKFDLYDTVGEGYDSTGLYLNGAAPTIPALDLSQAGIYLHNGHIFAAHIDYINGVATGTITDTLTGASASQVLEGYVAQPGEQAYVGFTAATGSTYSATQNILTWKYQGGTGCAAPTTATQRTEIHQ